MAPTARRAAARVRRMTLGGSPMHRSIALVCITALVVSAATATAASLITGKNVKNGSLTGADVKSKSLPLGDLSKGTQALIKKGGTTLPGSTTPGNQGEHGQNGANGANGAPGANGANGSNGANGANGAAAVGPHWGAINRNTIKTGIADLRNGPFVSGANGSPPFGDGSLELQTADSTSAAAFGNEVDFAGDPVSGLNEVGFRVYTTGENNGRGTPNTPSIAFEIDPNLNTNASNFSTMVFQPQSNSPTNQWSGYIDGTTSTPSWWLTGAPGTAINCTQANKCTLAQVKSALAGNNDGTPAQIATAEITKGRDFEFEGAVDGLRINNEVFDFELFGVTTRTP
jgi:hypothetical protein